MIWNHHLGHLHSRKLRILYIISIIPKKFTAVKPHKCVVCIYGEMNKSPWHNKGKKVTNMIQPVTAPGQYMSVNQLECLLPGFISQLKGTATKNRYREAAVFVDNFRRMGCTYLQRNLTSDETLKEKSTLRPTAEKKEWQSATTTPKMEYWQTINSSSQYKNKGKLSPTVESMQTYTTE